MRMKKSISALCAAAVLMSSVVGVNALFSARGLYAEEIVEDGSGEGVQLAVPQNVRFEDGFIKWDKVEEAYGYILRMRKGEEDYQEFTKYFDYDDPDDEAQVELDRLCYENNIDFGEHTFDVCIFDQEWNRSEWSDAITAEYAPTLDAPTNVHVIDKENMNEDDEWYWCNDETILWDKVDGAYRYNIRIYNDDDDRTLYTATYTGSAAFEYKWYVYDSGDYWISVQSMDQDYNVSEWTEPVKVSHAIEAALETPQNLRLDESGENIIWDEVEDAEGYVVNFWFYVEKNGSHNTINYWCSTNKAQLDNWKSNAIPSSDGEYYFSVSAYGSNIAGSQWSDTLTISCDPVCDETLELPETLQLEDGYLHWNAANNAKNYYMFFLRNGKYLDVDPYHWKVEDYLWDIEDYSNDLSHFINNRIPEGSYEIELFVTDKNGNYNSKTYSLILNTPHDETVWIPKIHYKGTVLLWDYDRIRHDNTYHFWIRVKDVNDGTIVKLERDWSEYFYGLSELPNGNYTIEVCAYEYSDKLGPWSEPLKIIAFNGNYFDEENESTVEIVPPPEIEETIPEEERITSITINPAFNMKHKDGDDVELDISKITIKAEEIYDEEGLKRVEEALGHEIKPNQKYNLLDLTLLYDGEDFSNGYEGLVQVIIPIPSGHRDKTFTVYRLTEVDGQIVKEVIPGEQTEDSYIIYLEHFSEYALFGEGEHIHDFAEEWITDEISHWKECECGEKSEEAEHIYGDWTVTKEATETEEGTQERTCEVCGYTQTENIDVLPHTHKYGEVWEKDETNHWQICEGCGEESEKTEHNYGDWTVTKEATETEEGIQERTCEVCGYKQTEAIPTLPHTHVFGEDWNIDETSHWKECECGEKSEEAAHTYGDWTVTKEATEAEEGTRERACEICGYKQTEAIPALPHTHVFGKDWNTDETSHWKECECGEKSEEAAHNYSEWTVTKEATEAEEGVRERSCEICGYKETEALPKLTPAAPSETDKPDDITDNTNNTDKTDKPEPETPNNDNPPTGIAAVEASITVLAVCGAAMVLTAKKRKNK